MPNRIPISDLQEITEVSDLHYLAVDDGESTKKINVGNFNDTATQSAKRYAEAAATSAQNASDSASNAQSTASEIDIKLNTASTLVSDAETYAAEALANKNASANSAAGARQSANAAASSSNEATSKVTAAELHALMAKSWAEGNTGLRVDEAINNAKYWASVAMNAAGGGVASFNGRGGAVVPTNADYTADMIKVGLDGENNPIYVSDVLEELENKHDTNADDISDLQSDVEDIQGKVTVLTSTLAIGETTLTFTSNKIKANSLINVYADVDKVAPISRNVVGTTLTLTFDAQEVAVSIKARIEN